MSSTRLETVMAMPEAAGRRPLAEHLATKTDLSLKQIRENLSVAHADPVAVAQEIIDGHRALAAGKPPPSHVASSTEDDEAAKLAAEIVGRTADRRGRSGGSSRE